MSREDVDLAEWYELIEVRNMYTEYYQAERKSQANKQSNGHVAADDLPPKGPTRQRTLR